VGLLSKPMHLLSEEELTAHVQRIRELRSSAPTFRSALNKKDSKDSSENSVPSKSQADLLDEYA
jgi:hypothetical protein